MRNDDPDLKVLKGRGEGETRGWRERDLSVNGCHWRGNLEAIDISRNGSREEQGDVANKKDLSHAQGYVHIKILRCNLLSSNMYLPQSAEGEKDWPISIYIMKESSSYHQGELPTLPLCIQPKLAVRFGHIRATASNNVRRGTGIVGCVPDTDLTRHEHFNEGC